MEERAERAERTKNDGDIRMAILKTVAYADLFDFPLKAGEIQRYLHQVEADQIQVDRSLAALVGSESRLNQVDDYYMLPQRERIVETRRERTQTAAQLWPQALHYGHMLARFPYIRMVALTGALAVENAISEDDLDYFIVTEPGRVWLTRAFTLLLVRAEARRGITLCPNYFLSGSALALDQKNLYVAREITQMVPLSGRRVYNQLREQNLWTRDFLPNASGAPNEQAILDRESGGLQRTNELLFSGALGNALERWEMNRKIEKFRSLPDFSEETRFGPDCCQGHFGGYQAKTMERFDDKVNRLEPVAEWEHAS